MGRGVRGEVGGASMLTREDLLGEFLISLADFVCVCVGVCLCVCVGVCLYACACMYIRMYVYVVYLCIYICIYIYIQSSGRVAHFSRSLCVESLMS